MNFARFNHENPQQFCRLIDFHAVDVTFAISCHFEGIIEENGNSKYCKLGKSIFHKICRFECIRIFNLLLIEVPFICAADECLHISEVDAKPSQTSRDASRVKKFKAFLKKFRDQFAESFLIESSSIALKIISDVTNCTSCLCLMRIGGFGSGRKYWRSLEIIKRFKKLSSENWQFDKAISNRVVCQMTKSFWLFALTGNFDPNARQIVLESPFRELHNPNWFQRVQHGESLILCNSWWWQFVSLEMKFLRTSFCAPVTCTYAEMSDEKTAACNFSVTCKLI